MINTDIPKICSVSTFSFSLNIKSLKHSAAFFIPRVFNALNSPIASHSKRLNVPILFLLKCPAETTIR